MYRDLADCDESATQSGIVRVGKVVLACLNMERIAGGMTTEAGGLKDPTVDNYQKRTTVWIVVWRLRCIYFMFV